MTSTFYGATMLLNPVPDEQTVADIAHTVANKHFPNKEYQFIISQTLPTGLSDRSHRELAARKTAYEGSAYLIITPKR